MEANNELNKRMEEINHDIIHNRHKITEDEHLDILGERLGIESELEDTAENKEEFRQEWGPELGWNGFEGALEEIAKLNENLPSSEKPWRLPTREELLFAVKNKPSMFEIGGYWTGDKTGGSAWSVLTPTAEVVYDENYQFARIRPTR